MQSFMEWNYEGHWNFNFERFDIIYVCAKSMVGEWCDILVVHRK